MTDVLIVSEEQAVALEKAGIKVEVQYIVRIADMLKLHQAPAQVARPQPAPAVKKRRVRYGQSVLLRWTGLKWAGRIDTEAHHAYTAMADYFNDRSRTNKVASRVELTKLMVAVMSKQSKAFNAGTITYLCDQKYLEPVT
jgi:hypothetical protein